MFRPIKIFALALFLFTASAQSAQDGALPKRILANYVISKNGAVFAKVREQYVVTGQTYKIESITKGVGIYALLGTRKLTSVGEVSDSGLKPTRFELHQGRNDNKTLITDFDWAKNTLHMQIKGPAQDAPLSADTQDLASFAYQFMFLPRPLNNTISVKLTTGKKLNTYQYKVSANQEVIRVADTAYKTVHLTPLNQPKDQVETKELWLSAEKNYVLVKLLMVDNDGEKLEQTLTELHVD